MALFSLQLGEDEKVLTIIRKHWVTFLSVLLRFFIILAVLVSFYCFFPDNSWKLIVVFVLGGLDLGFLLYKLIVWHLGNVVVTNQRIIDINQQSLNKRVIVETLIGDITEVLFFKEGIFQKLFRMGTLVIEIKGGGKIIGFCAKDPKRLAGEINKLKYRDEQSGSKLEKIS
ncbi:MAG: hypothetical protein U9Q72_00020 [Patescibacteria group bacterium]|nr:hypothetical protein [Patescibacteria group bacterium]